MSFGQIYSYFLPWAATAVEVQAAIANVRSSFAVQVTSNQIFVGQGMGYEYFVNMVNEAGAITQSNFALDISQLRSVSPSNNFQSSITSDVQGTPPKNYRYQWIYSDCKYAAINSTSSHQIIVITSAVPDIYGAGSFRLSFSNELSDCIAYNASLDGIRSALMQLSLIDYVFVEEYKWTSATFAYREIHVFLGGSLVNEWPLLRVVPFDNGRNWGSAYFGSCDAKSISTTNVEVIPIDDYAACSSGSSDVQIIIAEAEDVIAGFFQLHFRGAQTGPISVNASAPDVAAALNTLLPDGGVSVTRYIHRDAPFTGYAWAVTFPENLGNVEYMYADDQHVSGINPAVAVYPMVNISFTADKADISGHFSITMGHEATIPLSWDATDGAVLNAIQNLTSISKAVMIGYRENESPARLHLQSIVGAGLTNNITIDLNATGLIAPGDPILFVGYNDTVAGRYVSGIAVSTFNKSILFISENINFSVPGNISIAVGSLKFSRVQLPGRVSVLSNTSSSFVIYITQSWEGFVTAGDLIWVGDLEFQLLSTPNSTSFSLDCSAKVVVPFEGAVAFRWGEGFERAVVIKSASTEVRNARALLLGDTRGTNLIVRTDHSDGVSPQEYLLGSLFEIQTVSFRPDSLAVSLAAKSNASQFELVLGSEAATAINLTYGSSAAVWESAIESMTNVDRVEVIRTGDGQSSIYAYGIRIYSDRLFLHC